MRLNRKSDSILIAEDDPRDVLLLKRALQKNGVKAGIHFVSDGAEAIDYLCAKPPYHNRSKNPFPGIIYVDLKMPRFDGMEFLRWMHSHPQYLIIPVIVFSASTLESDIKSAYELGAHAYIPKPQTFDELTEVVRITLEFWSLCERPAGP
jgi:CheY-like chemotaxis protein